MRATDRWAIDAAGVPGTELMAAAGGALADAVTATAPQGPVVVVCGAGNNGGDGYVAARLLRDAGRPVRVLSTVPDERLRGDAAWARDGWGAPGEAWDPAALEGAAVLVDAILGTGATGAPRGTAGEAIAALAAAGRDGTPVVACDVPSGVDATTGEVAGDAVPATVTVTFHAAPPGLWITPGKTHAGEVRVVPIGIPDDAAAHVPAAWAGLLTARLLDALPTRAPGGTKFRSGHVVVAGGAPGMSGAPCLAARGAMRAGAGYVTVAAPAAIETAVLVRAPVEALGRTLPDGEDGGLTVHAVGPLLEAVGQHGGTLVVGPGLGRGGSRPALVRALAERVDGPVLFDADALFAVAGDPEALRSAAHPDRPAVLTPHAGELSRLLDVPTDDVAAHRLQHARDAARRAGAVVVLKGDDTLVAAPDGRVGVSPGGVPALATAGTGDVLSGVIGALLARGTDPFVAACAGVWLHLRAGALAAEEHGTDGVVATDVADRLGHVRRRHGAGEG
nr:NAD(P)H-hydrate dehydratase [Patulibacter sp. SYSU D01012]